ncbi:SH3 domain-containing protein [Sulfitobacter sp. KE34]|jgi:uncharacterized membrane protein|uniref:SH3 domain-containing protein n=1 Tax=Sulfitobacter faviae TaxID=1775881 RepID=A0AAX3LQD5_9RHOB|nr:MULTISPECIES: SH3 domain-containing protein [Sulfitobacter]MDF3349833.1 SH3 domain-containing protein [Sulfitobacter sp. KE12]MDF3353505.1 SH3 domain-containing protein [Sulfitobacter sp. KE27]MDF3357152.1 SH3 domain-containing protein [Sulfitobacter sp. KE33]MDF3361513.1 SH3 domain-containing protein [Sulfitobacter sp. Ks41]MDF3364576.1 SH3 domain-containing protein [Sulfitobacter sp. Ks34]
MRLLALFLCLWALPVWATQDAWPALHDVSGVAADDVLNIREAPSASAPIIGSFAPDTQNIEVIRPDDHHGWGLVNTGEGSGWVSLRFLIRQAGQWAGAMPPVAHCDGTEPFWSFEVTGEALSYDAMAGGARDYRITQSGPAQGRRDSFHMIAEGPQGAAIATLTARACSDGMSDRAYGLAVNFLLQGNDGWQHQTGCCSLSH